MKYLLPLVIMTALSGCVKNESHIGYNFPDHYQERLKKNITTKDMVLDNMGSPTIESTYGDSVYYYITQKQVSKAFFHPKVVDQKIIALTFNKKDILVQIKQYGLQEFRDLELDHNRTELKGNEMGVLEQLMSNVGRFGSAKKSPGM